MNIKIQTDKTLLGALMSFALVEFIAYFASNGSILIMIIIALGWYLVYYLEKETGIYFNDIEIKIIDGLFFKKKYIYKYENLKELDIKVTVAPGLMGNTFYLLFEDGFKYKYYVDSTHLDELIVVKEFIKEKGILVNDDSEPPVYGR